MLTYYDGYEDGYRWELLAEEGDTLPLPADDPGEYYEDGFRAGQEARRLDREERMTG
jgi:hypothetical protein